MGSADEEAELAEFIHEFAFDPLGFVMAAFPWGEPGTPLERESGPDVWQRANLEELGRRLREHPEVPVLDAVAAANGVGKSADLAWIFWWLICTWPKTRIKITANTATQLATATQPEIMKWHKLLICGHWFEVTATQVFALEGGMREAWRADFTPWNKANPSAFQGLHNKGERLAWLVDEAAGIPDVIWDAMYGSLTDADTQIFMIVRFNPTLREGEAYRIFTGSARERWSRTHVSGWDAKSTNKALLQQWKEQYGENSDFYRVRVLGQFPHQSAQQFISEDVVRAARKRPAVSHPSDPLIIGADIARQGGDKTRIVFRRGMDCRTIPMIWLPFVDSEGYLMQVAARIAAEARQHGADAICIDAEGLGWGVVDRLQQMRIPNVHAIQYGSAPIGCWAEVLPFRPKNRKAEIWGGMKYAMPHLAIEDADDLQTDLTGPYAFDTPEGELMIEPKIKMAKRGLASPDWAEALANTWAVPVEKVTWSEGVEQLERGRAERLTGRQPGDYDPFAAL